MEACWVMVVCESEAAVGVGLKVGLNRGDCWRTTKTKNQISSVSSTTTTQTDVNIKVIVRQVISLIHGHCSNSNRPLIIAIHTVTDTMETHKHSVGIIV